MRRALRRAASVALVLAGALQALAGSEPPRAEPRVVIGSKNFVESTVLAELMAQVLERAGASVERRFDLGGTLLCFEALRAGELSAYPEYTGTALVALLDEALDADLPARREPLDAYLHARRGLAERFELELLEPFGFENTYAIAVRAEVARRLGLRTLSDLGRVGRELSLGASAEFLRRSDGLAALEARYGIGFRDVRSLSHELAYQALAERQIDAIDAYTTDAELECASAVCLEDDRRCFPPYHAAPLVRRDLLERWPRARTALETLAGRIDAGAMRRMNAAVLGGEPVPDVARRFLEEAQLHRRTSARELSTAATLRHELADLARWTLQHVTLAGLAVLAAAATGVPAGIFLARRARAAGVALSVLGVLQTVPSLALLGLLLPLLGIGFAPAVVALFLYALLPIVRGTLTGLRAIDPLVLETADALGLTRRQRLARIELPLALESIVGGLRTSTVIALGTATLAAFIGAGGLGEPIFTGLKLARTSLILEGAVPAALLAIGADLGLAWIERIVRRRRSP